jgi:choline dehydrogenase
VEFDYVIVGGGSAGCVLASRLSEAPGVSVLLVEAGGPGGGFWESVPLGVGKILNQEDRLWRNLTQPSAGSAGREISWISGRGLGGSSAVNGMLFVRGHPAMYDRMAASGCEGWDYASCLPYFKRLEDCRFSTSANRAAGGPIGVSLAEPDPISEAFLASCTAAGYSRVADYNDQRPDGASYLQLSIRRGLRSGAAVGYLRPHLSRANLTVLTDATARAIRFDGRKARGVVCSNNGRVVEASARREVILCAGALRTPALLERSGIGRRDLLEGLGIKLVADRREVGQNLHDHFMPRVCFETSERGTVNHMLNSRWAQIREVIRFVTKRRGLFADPSLKATAYVRSDPSLELPNLRLQVGLVSSESRVPASGNSRSGTPAARAGLDPESSFQIGVYDIYPQSRGSTHIASADPEGPLHVQPNYLGTETDRRTIATGLALVERLARSSPLRDVIVRQIRPAYAEPQADQPLRYASATAETCWHPVGTCRMGSDAASVVDSECRVREADSLRVVDASVFPFLTSSNTNIPVIMLAERIADRMRHAS